MERMDQHAAGAALAGIALQVSLIKRLVILGVLSQQSVKDIGEDALLSLETMAGKPGTETIANEIARSIIERMVLAP